MADIPDQIKDHAELHSLYRYWDDKRGDRSMPSRADLDPIDMKRWLGHLILTEVLREPLNFQYRVFGTRVAEVIGRDYTGQTLEDVHEEVREPLRRSYEKVVETRQPLFKMHEENAVWGDDFLHRRLMLPLSDDDKSVSMVLIGAYVGPVRTPE